MYYHHHRFRCCHHQHHHHHHQSKIENFHPNKQLWIYFPTILEKKRNCVTHQCEKTQVENWLCMGGAVSSKSHQKCCGFIILKLIPEKSCILHRAPYFFPPSVIRSAYLSMKIQGRPGQWHHFIDWIKTVTLGIQILQKLNHRVWFLNSRESLDWWITLSCSTLFHVVGHHPFPYSLSYSRTPRLFTEVATLQTLIMSPQRGHTRQEINIFMLIYQPLKWLMVDKSTWKY